MTLIRFSSPRETNVGFRKCRLRFLDFELKMWLRNALWRFTFPDAVTVKVFAALRLLFIFGIVLLLFHLSL